MYNNTLKRYGQTSETDAIKYSCCKQTKTNSGALGLDSHIIKYKIMFRKCKRILYLKIVCTRDHLATVNYNCQKSRKYSCTKYIQ